MTPTDKITFLRSAAHGIFARSLEDCSVPRAFRHRIRLSGDGTRTLHLDGDADVDLTGVRRILVIGAGKGASSMMQCLLELLRPLTDLTLEGILIAAESIDELPPGIRLFTGGHPLPNETSFAGAQAAFDLLGRYAAADADTIKSTFCFFLISGGASAMLELPLDPSIGLDDTISFHSALVHSGATIAQINCVRKHFSAVKGGRLASAAGPLRCLTVAISDVPSGQLDALGSGPTLPDTSTLSDCNSVLERYNLAAQFTPAVKNFFGSAALVETPKELGPQQRFYVLLSEEQLGQAACSHAEELGFHVILDAHCDDWDYKDAAVYLIDRFRSLRDKHPMLCLVSRGEVTVQLDTAQKLPGRGGRNQQLALYASTLLQAQDQPLVLLSVGSDGIDGNSPAAGAIIDSEMFVEQESRRLVETALSSFDAYPLLHARGASVVTGRTGNNLRDLRLILTA